MRHVVLQLDGAGKIGAIREDDDATAGASASFNCRLNGGGIQNGAISLGAKVTTLNIPRPAEDRFTGAAWTAVARPVRETTGRQRTNALLEFSSI
jgi:hypothetical protein